MNKEAILEKCKWHKWKPSSERYTFRATQMKALEEILNSLPDIGFGEMFDILSAEVYQTAVERGWHSEGERNKGERIALMHSELSEALEAIRHGNPPDDKMPEFSGVEAELADVVIRIMDMASAEGYHVGKAVIAKMAYNKTRLHKHGGKKF